VSISYTPRSWTTGEVVTAAFMNNEIATPFTGLQAVGQSWTPGLFAATTNPTLGTGSAQIGSFLQMGKWFFVRATITFGSSGVVAGSGAYGINALPLTLRALTNDRQILYGNYAIGGGNFYDVMAVASNGGVTSMNLYYIAASLLTQVTAAAPAAPTAATFLNVAGWLESA